MSSMRTFIAVEVPPSVRRAAADLIGRFEASAAHVRWVDPEQTHITLKFLGDVVTERVPEICRRVAEAVAPIPPFRLTVLGAGAFPNTRRPRTIWLGTAEGRDAMVVLHEAIDRQLDPMGFPRETRRFVPHLTLGRVRRGVRGADALGPVIEEQTDVQAGIATVREVVVFASFLGRDGPTYQVLGHAELGTDV